MRRVSIVLVLAGMFLGAAPTTQPVSAVAARARHSLETMKASSYQHVSDIDEGAGEYFCDCSGFVGWVLRKETPEAYRAVKFPKTTKRPRAVDYYEAFLAAPADAKEAKGWVRVERVADAHVGDILAWRKVVIPEQGTTGHVVVLDSAPKAVAVDVYEIVVIDSTSRPHHEDTRKGDETGLGRGTVYVKVDEEGKASGFGSRGPDGPFSKVPVAIGRPMLSP
jgi:hypothetical protein